MIWVLVFALFMIAAAYGSVRKPGIAIAVMLVMFGVEQLLQSQSSLFIQNGSLVNIGVGLTAACAAFFLLLRDSRALPPSNLQITAIVLYVLAWVSQLWISTTGQFQARFGEQLPYMILFLVVGPILCREQRSVQDAVKWTFFFGAGILLLMTVFSEWEGRAIRMAAPVMHGGKLRWATPPLALSSLASTIGILSMILMPRRIAGRIMHFLVAAVALYVLFRTQSRGQLVFASLSCMIFYPIANRSNSGKVFAQTVGISIVVGVALYIAFNYIEVDNNRWHEKSVTGATAGRMMMAKVLFATWLRGDPAIWVLGLGASSSFDIAGFYIHNVPLEVLCELGIIGAVIYLLFYYQTLTKSLNLIQNLPALTTARQTAVGMVALMFMYSLLSLKEGSLFGFTHLFFIAIAIDSISVPSVSTRNTGWRDVFIQREPVFFTNHRISVGGNSLQQ